MRYRYYIEKMQQTFSQWLGKIPKKEHTMYTRVKVLCIVCGALYPGGCLAILAKPEGNLSFGILHAVKVAVITRQGHIGYGTSLILIVALILYIKVVGRSRDNEDERNFSYSAKGTYGTSRIATEEEYKNYLSITDSALETDGIILGTTMDSCYIGWCVAAGSFFWTAILLWKKRSIYEGQVTEMTNSVIAIEDETLRCYQAVGNVYESCWIHFSDITDVIFNKKKQAFLIQITEDPKRKSEICVNSILVEENLFEVRGGNYKLDEFLKIFQKVIPYGHSNQRIDIELVRKQWETDMRMKHFYQWFPWSILGVIVIMQIL